MKFKKLLAGCSVFCMAAVLFLPLPASASESGTTTLITKVPDTHSAELVIEGKGTVKVEKQEYKISQTIKLPRLTKFTYEFAADEGWQLKNVSYGKGDSVKEVAVTGTSFTPEEVYEDGYTLRVVFTEQNKTDTGNYVQTGDQTNAALWGVLLIGSAAAVCSLKKKKIKTNH